MVTGQKTSPIRIPPNFLTPRNNNTLKTCAVCDIIDIQIATVVSLSVLIVIVKSDSSMINPRDYLCIITTPVQNHGIRTVTDHSRYINEIPSVPGKWTVCYWPERGVLLRPIAINKGVILGPFRPSRIFADAYFLFKFTRSELSNCRAQSVKIRRVSTFNISEYLGIIFVPVVQLFRVRKLDRAASKRDDFNHDIDREYLARLLIKMRINIANAVQMLAKCHVAEINPPMLRLLLLCNLGP